MSNKKQQRQRLIIIAFAVAAVIAFGISLCVGKYPLTLDDISAILTGGEVGKMDRQVFFNLRLPRTIMAVLAGLSFGMTGSIYQTIFKNPLAAPDIIGVASGANLGAALAIVLVGNTTLLVAGGSFIFALLTVLLVMALVGSTRNQDTSTYVLAGIVLTAISEALIMILKFFADAETELAALEFWTMGSFGSVTMTKLITVAPICLIGILGMILLRRQVALLSLNDDESRMMGVKLKQIRIAVLGFSTLAIASVISVTGLISFVGLVAPHIAKLIRRRNDFNTCLLGGLIGVVVLLYADCLARTLYSSELPISILTTFIGVPFLVYFMCKKGGRR